MSEAALATKDKHSEHLMKRLSDSQRRSWRWLSFFTALAITLMPLVSQAENARLAVVIDDLGYHQRGCRDVLALPGPLNLAFLPHTPFAAQYAEKAHQSGHTIMLHLPMSNHSGAKLGPGGVNGGMSHDVLAQTMRDGLVSIPHVQGFNNHMGSRLTENRTAMDTLMTVAAEQGLFFIDSRTTVKTTAQQAAREANIPNLRRHVFLDNDTRHEALARQFKQAVRLARKKGLAVLIGHPYPETLAFLRQQLPNLDSDIELIRLDDELLVAAPPVPSAPDPLPETVVAEIPEPAVTEWCPWCTPDHDRDDRQHTESVFQPDHAVLLWPWESVVSGSYPY